MAHIKPVMRERMEMSVAFENKKTMI